MNAAGSRLAFLMNAMGITGRKLAEAIHIDYSQVSRWKNNRRPISPTHARRIAGYFLTLEQSRASRFLEEFLKDYNPALNTASQEDLAACLGKWLSESEPLTQHQISILSNRAGGNKYLEAACRIYKGNEGRRIAAIDFLDHVLALPPGQQLLLLSQEDISWIIEDASFLAQWKQKLLDVLKNNHKIQIIHWVDRKIENLSAIVTEWLPLHLTGNIESWFYPIYSEIPFKSTLFIIKNSLAVTGMTSKNPAQDRYTAFFTDPVTVAQCEWIYKCLLAECRPLIKVGPKSELSKLFDPISDKTDNEPSIFYADLPLILASSEEILAGVLAENQVDPAVTERCLKYHQDLSRLIHADNLKRAIYDLNHLKQASAMPAMTDYPLSVVASRDISIPRKYFIENIHLLIEKLEKNPNFEMALRSTINEPNHIPVQLWVKQNTSIIAWSNNPYLPYAASATEPTIVNTFYHIYHKIWQSIPKIFRDKDWVINELQKLTK